MAKAPSTSASGERSTPRIERHLSSRRTAEILGVAAGTVRNWRVQGRGPRGWIRLSGNKIIYPESAVLAFLEQRARSTAGKLDGNQS